MSDVTHVLQAAQAGDPQAAAELLPLVYAELRRLAAHRLAGERHEHTLQPTALVHEAWLKVAGTDERTWQGRQHFFSAAAEAMRRILVDRARRRQAAKRNAGAERLDADEWDLPAPAPDEQLLAVDEGRDQCAAPPTNARWTASFSRSTIQLTCTRPTEHGPSSCSPAR